MPILHTINEELGVVLSTWVGSVSDENVVGEYRQLYDNKRWKPGFHEIADMRDVDVSGLTGKGVREVSMMVEGYTAGKCEGFKTAVIASEDLPFGLARMYEAVSNESPESVMVFRTVEAALEWMGVGESLIR
jgi:hypothetical protein